MTLRRWCRWQTAHTCCTLRMLRQWFSSSLSTLTVFFLFWLVLLEPFCVLQIKLSSLIGGAFFLPQSISTLFHFSQTLTPPFCISLTLPQKLASFLTSSFSRRRRDRVVLVIPIAFSTRTSPTFPAFLCTIDREVAILTISIEAKRCFGQCFQMRLWRASFEF